MVERETFLFLLEQIHCDRLDIHSSVSLVLFECHLSSEFLEALDHIWLIDTLPLGQILIDRGMESKRCEGIVLDSEGFSRAA